jgi:Zn-dependent M28 family amino/carboxypeptidase
LFVATTGEEVGFLGAAHFVAHPPVDRAAIVADLNFDDILGLKPLHDVVALGIEATTLVEPARAAAAALGLSLSPDPEPEQNYLGRGDNKKFSAAGIPALRIEPGDGDEHGDLEAGRRLHKEWLATRYHTPRDEWSAGDDYEAMAGLARFGLVLGALVANAPARPALKK